MKPISLEIQGVNSFKEKQIVDFSGLFTHGVFGVFGPTGSGKSTVLDSLFLALYGKMERANKCVGFINVELSEAKVALDFMARDYEGEKKYRVERTFKQSKNGDEIKQSAVLYEYIYGDEIVKGDVLEVVNGMIIGLVGYSYDDFKRCVSLSQGEFNSFVKESHKERVETIGRMFDLTKYSENLDKNIADQINLLDKKIYAEEAKLEVYGDISKEALLEKNSLLSRKREDYKLAKNSLQQMEQTVKIGSDMLAGKKKLSEIRQKIESINSEEDNINSNIAVFERGKKAQIIMPKLRDMLESEKKVLNFSAELKKLHQDLKEKSEYEVNELKKYEQIKNSAYGEILKLNSRNDKLEMLKPDVKRMSELITLRDELILQHESFEKLLRQKVLERDSLNELLVKSEKYIDSLSAEVANVDISKEAVKTITVARDIEIEKRTYRDQQKQLEEEIGKIIEAKQEFIMKIKKLSREIDESKQKLKKGDDKLVSEFGAFKTRADVLSNLTCENNTIHNVVEFVQVLNTIIKAQLDNMEIDAQKTTEYAKNAISAIEVREGVKKNRGDLQKELDTVYSKKDEYLANNIEQMLKNRLDIGNVCPVCENTIGKLSKLPTVSLDSYANEIKVIRHEIEESINAYILAESAKSAFNGKAEERDELVDLRKIEIKKLRVQRDNLLTLYHIDDIAGDDIESLNEFLQSEDEELDRARQIIETNDQLEKDIAQREKVAEKMAAEMLSINEVELSLKNRLESVTKTIDELTLQYLKYEEVLKGISARSISDIIMDNDGKKARTIVKLAEQKEVKQSCLVHVKELESEINEIKIQMNSIASISSGYEKERLEILKRIEKFIPSNSTIENEQKVCSDKILELKNIEQTQYSKYEKLSRLIRIIDKALSEKNAMYKIMLGELNEKKKEGLELLKKYGFESVNELKNAYIEKADIARIETAITNFTSEKSKVLSERDKLINLTEGFDLKEEEFETVKLKYADTKKNMASLEREIFIMENSIDEVKEKVKAASEIKQVIQEYKSQIKKHEKLKNLSGGGKVLDYIAQDYISYIESKASEILVKLTSGRYYLLYEKNEFVIIDNLNGGIKRDVFTLSGGETFLVSLSVSIAMSTAVCEISKRPLTVFFLDEGFGTLDKDLVENVAVSLEKLENSSIQIGIISHVPQLQEKIKKKVVLTAPQGKNGSKISVSV